LHRIAERLPEDAFNLKSFIFSNDPDEWSFTLAEPLDNMLQFVDITSHETGEPSGFAKEHILMYGKLSFQPDGIQSTKRTHTNEESLVPHQVNEVGHSKLYNQNVWIEESDSDVVVYYLKAKLQLGKTVELLTNYSWAYEGVREKRGYGLRNILEGVKPNSHADRLQRGFADREHVNRRIDCTDSIQRLPIINAMTEANVAGALQEQISPKQRVATQRICWIAQQVWHKLQRMKGTTADKSLFMRYEMEMKKQLDTFQASFVDLVRPVLKLGNVDLGNATNQALEYEQVEEICFGVRDKLHMVKEDGVYCTIANSLIDTLCKHTASLMAMEIGMQEALGKFYEAAREAKGEILECVRMCDVASLQFTSGVVDGSLEGSTERFQSNFASNVDASLAFFIQNSTIPKGIVAALSKARSMPTELLDILIASASSKCFVMKRCDEHPDFGGMNKLASVPSEATGINSPNDINEEWYIYTQVVWIVDVFASQYLKGSLYSIRKLARELDVDLKQAELVVECRLTLVGKKKFRGILTGKPQTLK
jgi:hypothetical protein